METDPYKTGDKDQLVPLYSPDFFQTTPRDKWQKFMDKLDEKLGRLDSYELRQTHKVTFRGTSNSGTTTTLIYEVKYAKFPAIETLVVFQPSSGGPPLITGHNVRSDAFLE